MIQDRVVVNSESVSATHEGHSRNIASREQAIMPANALIDELMMRWEEARLRGVVPSAAEVCCAHPELLETVSRLIAQRLADQPGSTTESGSGCPTDPPTPSEVGETTSLSGAEQWNDGLRPPLAAGEIGRLGPFRVVKFLGAGGMGAVYEAVDSKLGRSVALKVIRPRLADSATAQARFLREARTAATFEHAHVVSIFQVGEDNGVSYLAMPLLRGLTLGQRLKQDARLTTAEVLRIGREIAEGLAAAHLHGLIHRDIKPGNIWLDEISNRVKILDFGLARLVNDPARLTDDGTVLGTPAYMAPEQARGQCELDYRSDLFSLGGVLYRMATGQRPFPAENTADLLMAVAWSDPIPPRQLDPEISPVLEDLILRLLAKDPAARPQSADFVVEAIHDLEGRIAPAAPLGPGLPVRLEEEEPAVLRATSKPPPRRRYPVAGAFVAVFLLLLLVSGLALFAPTFHPEGGRGDLPPSSPGPAVEVHTPAPDKGAPSPAPSPRMQPPPYPEPAAPLAWPTPPPVLPKLPGIIAAPARLAGLGRWQVETRSPRDAVVSLSWSPDRRRLACAAGEKVVRIYETDHLELVALLVGHTGPVFSAAWSPDGTRLATGSRDGTVRVWNAEGAPGPVLQGHSGSIWSVSWNRDGSRLASAGYDRTVHVWSTDGTPALRLEHPSEAVAVAWSPDGKQLASASAGRVYLWDANGTPGPVLSGHTKNIHSVAWSPDGTPLASASDDGTVRLWGANGTPGLVFSNHAKGVKAVAWSPDGERLASGGGDSRVRVWGADGTPGPVLEGLTRTVDSVCWSPDGKRLAAGSSAAELALWDANGIPGPMLAPVPTSAAVAFRPDGNQIISSCLDNSSLLLWGPDHVPGTLLKTRSRRVRCLAWSPDGTRFAAAGSDHAVQVWDADGTSALTLKGHTAPIHDVAWSPDGKRLASASGDNTARIWGSDGKPGPVLEGHDARVLAVRWSPDGTRLATTGEDGTVRLWRADGTPQDPPLQSTFPAISLAWSPDGARLAVGNKGTTLQLFGLDGETGPTLYVKPGNAEAIAWHPDSKHLATTSNSAVIRLWDVNGLEGPALTSGLSLGDWREAGVNVAWTADGKRLLAASRHGFVWVWNARTFQSEWVSVQTSPAGVALFRPDGRLLRTDPATLKTLVHMVERPDRGVELLTQREFEVRAAGK